LQVGPLHGLLQIEDLKNLWLAYIIRRFLKGYFSTGLHEGWRRFWTVSRAKSRPQIFFGAWIDKIRFLVKVTAKSSDKERSEGSSEQNLFHASLLMVWGSGITMI
jgi:hypothetical protein